MARRLYSEESEKGAREVMGGRFLSPSGAKEERNLPRRPDPPIPSHWASGERRPKNPWRELPAGSRPRHFFAGTTARKEKEVTSWYMGNHIFQSILTHIQQSEVLSPPFTTLIFTPENVSQMGYGG